MTQILTGSERMRRMFERRDHDRVPRFDHFWNETITRWKGEGLGGGHGAAHQLLGSDMLEIGTVVPSPFSGQVKVLRETEETRDYVDDWGATVRRWKNKSGTPEHIAFGCDSREVWFKQYKPIFEQLNRPLDAEYVLNLANQGRQAGQWGFLVTIESFELMRHIMGDELMLMTMVEDPEWIIDMSRTYTNTVLKELSRYMALGIAPEGLWIFGDMAYNHSTVCSPQMYRELVWPDHKRMADWAHQHNMKVIYHTDGDVNGVIDLYIEAGFDCLQPLEAKANMDLRQVTPRWGDRLAFCGNVNAMIMGENNRDRIEAEIVAKLTAGKSNHGYIYHSDHSVPPSVSLDTYRFVIDCLNRYGNYQ